MRIILPACLALIVSACATTSPERICTADWIETRADKAVAEIGRDTGRAIRSLREVGESYARGKDPSLLSMFQLERSLKRLERELTEGRGVRDLKTLARTCDDPGLVARGLDRWLGAQALPQPITEFVRALGVLEDLVERATDIED